MKKILLALLLVNIFCFSADKIHYRAFLGDSEGVRQLIQEGVDVDLRDEDQRTPLDWGVVGGQKDVADVLVYKRAAIDSRDINGQTPLHKAAHWSRAALAQQLLDQGAEVNAQDLQGKTPLHLASNVDVVKVLIDGGADINKQDYLGATPVHDAIKNGHVAVLRVLIKAGADLSLKNTMGKTAIDIIDAGESSQAVKTLIKQYLTRIQPLTEQLRAAAASGDVDGMKVVVEQGVPLNSPDVQGNTALHLAVQNNREHAVEYLLTLVDQLDLSLRNKQGKTALDAAADKPELLKLIKNMIESRLGSKKMKELFKK